MGLLDQVSVCAHVGGGNNVHISVRNGRMSGCVSLGTVFIKGALTVSALLYVIESLLCQSHTYTQPLYMKDTNTHWVVN